MAGAAGTSYSASVGKQGEAWGGPWQRVACGGCEERIGVKRSTMGRAGWAGPANSWRLVVSPRSALAMDTNILRERAGWSFRLGNGVNVKYLVGRERGSRKISKATPGSGEVLMRCAGFAHPPPPSPRQAVCERLDLGWLRLTPQAPTALQLPPTRNLPRPPRPSNPQALGFRLAQFHLHPRLCKMRSQRRGAYSGREETRKRKIFQSKTAG